jgi:hypothetical protein
MTSLTDDAYVGTLHYKVLDPPVSVATDDLQTTCDEGNTTTTEIVCAGLTATDTDIVANTGNITADGDITATNGDIKAQNGNIEAVVGNITLDSGDITATVGQITAGGNMTCNNLIALAGLVSAQTGVVANTGDITATTGDITAGNNITLGGDFKQNGTGDFETASGSNQLNGRVDFQAGFDVPLTNGVGTQISQNYIKNNMTFEGQVKFLGQINGTISIPEFCPVFPDPSYKTYTLIDNTPPNNQYALSLLATGDAGSCMFDLHTSHGNLRQNYSFIVESFCADDKGITPVPYVQNYAIYPPNNGTSNTDCCIQINYTDYAPALTQVIRIDVRIFYNPSPP